VTRQRGERRFLPGLKSGVSTPAALPMSRGELVSVK
jgi:hypothetical protein